MHFKDFIASHYYCEICSKSFPLSSGDCYSYFEDHKRKEGHHCSPPGVTGL